MLHGSNNGLIERGNADEPPPHDVKRRAKILGKVEVLTSDMRTLYDLYL
jgi:hypothetical protein